MRKSLNRIIYDIEKSNYIHSTENIYELKNKFPENLGFVLEENRVETRKNEKYELSRYTTYVIKNNNLVRLSYETNREESLSGRRLIGNSGHNTIVRNIRFSDENQYNRDDLELIIGLEKHSDSKLMKINRRIYVGYIGDGSNE